MGKGGKLHTSKPLIDGGLLFKAFLKCSGFLKHLGHYETLSRSSSPSYEGLVANSPLLEEILVLEASAELHPASVKAALLRLLSSDGSVNSTIFNGQVWINLRQERLCTLLCHLRKAVREPNTLQLASLKLNGQDLNTLKKVMGLVEIPLEKGSAEVASLAAPTATEVLAAPKVPESIASVGQQTVAYSIGGSKTPNNKRTLKKEVSKVSVDSDGFPAFLKQNEVQDDVPCERDPKHRNLGQKVSAEQWSKSQEQRHLKISLGFEAVSVSKRPASAKAKAVQTMHASSSNACVWVKLSKTIGKSPARSYILGSLEQGQKSKLIVEVSAKRSTQYVWIIDQILQELRSKNLSKMDALKLRDALCARHP